MTGNKAAYVYKLTYELPVKQGEFFHEDSPNCGYNQDPVQGGVFWKVTRDYGEETVSGIVKMTTFCVQLDFKTWYPCNPEDVEWRYLTFS